MSVEFRKTMLEKRSRLSKEEVREKSLNISEKLFNLKEYIEAETLFIYINFGNEVITTDIIEKAWADKKRVVAPISLKNRDMYFVEIKDFSNMVRKKIGTLEPNVDRSKEIIPDSKSLFIVPGSVFDLSLNRWGYGGGYYDTYIEKYGVKNTIGVCYDFQLLDSIEVKANDKKMKYILTEKRMVGGDNE